MKTTRLLFLILLAGSLLFIETPDATAQARQEKAPCVTECTTKSSRNHNNVIQVYDYTGNLQYEKKVRRVNKRHIAKIPKGSQYLFNYGHNYFYVLPEPAIAIQARNDN
jgi:hypothetical protein